jgi:hypothetical protein
MKKVLFVCMTVGLLATSCDWFKKTEPTEPIVETEVIDSTTTTTNDTTLKKADSTVAVVEQTSVKTETKKEVK